MSSLQGHLLVASTALVDPNFRKTVVLIVRHTEEEGALGLVLNRQTSATIKELWQRLNQGDCDNQSALSLGGPCEGPLMALHAEPTLGEIEVAPGLYFTAGQEHLTALVESRQATLRFFYGYAGWGPGQLEMELQEGAWRTEPAVARHVFSIDHELWLRATSEAAGWEVLSALKLKGVPPDPTMN